MPRDLYRRISVVLFMAICSQDFTTVTGAATYVVNDGHPLASDTNAGIETAPLKTINRAAQLARPGDTVLVHQGIYRERVAPARSGSQEQPIVYTAAPGEEVVIKGSDVFRPQWKKVSESDRVYQAPLLPALFRDGPLNPFRTPLKGMTPDNKLTLGQVFVDGRPLREVDDLVRLMSLPGTWMTDEQSTKLVVHFPTGDREPDQRLVELTTRDRIFAPHRRGLGYIHVRGFTMEHCANQFPDRFWESNSPQAGALGCRAGHHWLIEGNTVRYAKSIGIDCGYEGRDDLEGNQPTPQVTGYHVIRRNTVSDNGCCGIAGMRSIGTQIVENVVQRNNSNGHRSPEAAGIKVHYFIDGKIENNLVLDNDAYGIWLDNVYQNARVSRNVVVGNRGSAVFVELGQGPVIIDNNIMGRTRWSLDGSNRRADGLYTHDASGILFVHNLVFECQEFGSFHRKMTNRKSAGASEITLRYNIFVDNRDGHINMPYPGPDAHDNYADHNLFSVGGEFLVNPWGGTPLDGLIRKLNEQSSQPLKLWNAVSPRLSFKQWQQMHVWGFRSAESDNTRVTLSPDLVLDLEVGPSLRQLESAPLADVPLDYFNEKRNPGHPRVGPFGTLSVGNNRFSLWPNE
ncbi:MAG: right-handed parallel beta-helix repeat-containing protein [Planctomycetales bacterium]|nr:right-handed parallel beta-helix repeat-containing protein [Planctomycetales bacterium]